MTVELHGSDGLTQDPVGAAEYHTVMDTRAVGCDVARLLVFNAGNDGYSVATVAAPGTPIFHPIGGAPYAITFIGPSEGVSNDSLSVAGDPATTTDQLGFGPYGELDQTADATITLRAGAFTMTMTIDAVNGEVAIGPMN